MLILGPLGCFLLLCWHWCTSSSAVGATDRLRWRSRQHTTVSTRSAASHVPACLGHPSTAVPMQQQYGQQLGNAREHNETEMGQLPAIGEQQQIWLQPSAVQQRGAASASCDQSGRAKDFSNYLGSAVLSSISLSR